MNGLIGRKLGMTRVFSEDGAHVPVTVIEAGPCPVVQVREGTAQLGFGALKAVRTPKALPDVRAAAANAAVTAASTILSQSVKGQIADDLLAKGITEVREKLN